MTGAELSLLALQSGAVRVDSTLMRRALPSWLMPFATILLAGMLFGGIGPARGATSGTVVGANVLSAGWLDPALCATGQAGRTSFGSVTAGSKTVTGADCEVRFGSSNDTAMLRVYQQDGGGTAMSGGPLGTPDTTFGGGDGVVTQNVGSFSTAEDVVVQPDGKLLVVGESGLGAAGDVYVTRFTSAGVLDTSYGGGDGISAAGGGVGIVDYATSAHLLSSGKLLVVVRTGVGSDVGTIRYTADGALDTTYSGDGMGDLVDLGGTDFPRNSIVLAGDTIAIAARAATNTSLVMLQITSTGIADPAFGGGDGISDLVNLGATTDYGTDLHLLSTGKLLVSGYGGGLCDFVLVRFTATGTLDLTYGGGDGISQLGNAGGNEFAWSSELLSGDRVLVGGKGGPGDDFLAMRYDANGNLDLTYGGGDGISDLVNIGSANDQGYSMDLLTDGSMLLSGVGGASQDMVAVHYLADGTKDTVYGGGDAISTPFNLGGTERSNASLLLPGDKLVMAGYSDTGTFDFMLGRLDATSVAQYVDNGTADWDTAGSIDLFGACLRTVSDGAIAGGTAWTAGPAAACPATDGAYWNAIPAAPPGVKVAYTNAPDAQGGATDPTAYLRFGFRTRTNQPAGDYAAGIVFEVVAPDA